MTPGLHKHTCVYTDRMARTGQQMAAALKYVEAHPGCTKMAVAAHVRDKALNETLRDAYAVVDRLVRNKLVSAEFDGRRYSLTACPPPQ